MPALYDIVLAVDANKNSGVTQAVVLVIAWMRGARLFAMIDLARPHAV